jgi:hypothetical protein
MIIQVNMRELTPQNGGISAGGHMKGLTSETPSTGCFYYIININPATKDKDRCYVHSVERATDHASAPKIRLSNRLLAKRFNSLAICRSYCDFLNRAEGLAEFVVVMESSHPRQA